MLPPLLQSIISFYRNQSMTQHIQQLQTSVFQECQHFIKSIEISTLQANDMFWQQSIEKRHEHNPFSPTNLEIAISRVPSYIKCVQQCVER
jgi:hypothetical protein